MSKPAAKYKVRSIVDHQPIIRDGSGDFWVATVSEKDGVSIVVPLTEHAERITKNHAPAQMIFEHQDDIDAFLKGTNPILQILRDYVKLLRSVPQALVLTIDEAVHHLQGVDPTFELDIWRHPFVALLCSEIVKAPHAWVAHPIIRGYSPRMPAERCALEIAIKGPGSFHALKAIEYFEALRLAYRREPQSVFAPQRVRIQFSFYVVRAVDSTFDGFGILVPDDTSLPPVFGTFSGGGIRNDSGQKNRTGSTPGSFYRYLVPSIDGDTCEHAEQPLVDRGLSMPMDVGVAGA